MSELDYNRRAYLAQKIRDKQVLITSTDTDIAKSTDTTKLFRIKNGSVV
jgi:recombinational DNA repair ATPase RecF